jgi:hypothetical protein
MAALDNNKTERSVIRKVPSRNDIMLTEVVLAADAARDQMLHVIAKWPGLSSEARTKFDEAIDELDTVAVLLCKFTVTGLQNVH